MSFMQAQAYLSIHLYSHHLHALNLSLNPSITLKLVCDSFPAFDSSAGQLFVCLFFDYLSPCLSCSFVFQYLCCLHFSMAKLICFSTFIYFLPLSITIEVSSICHRSFLDCRLSPFSTNEYFCGPSYQRTTIVNYDPLQCSDQ